MAQIPQWTPHQAVLMIGSIRYLAQVRRELLLLIVELEIAKNQALKVSSWDSPWNMFPNLIAECHQLATLNKCPPTPLRFLPSLEIMGDAGPYSFGCAAPILAAGIWTVEQTRQSSNWRELKTWQILTQFCAGRIKGLMWVYLTDSVVAAAYINRMLGKSPTLSRIATKTWRILQSMQLTVQARVVDQATIAKADQLSRIVTAQTMGQREFFTLECQKQGATPIWLQVQGGGSV